LEQLSYYSPENAISAGITASAGQHWATLS